MKTLTSKAKRFTLGALLSVAMLSGAAIFPDDLQANPELQCDGNICCTVEDDGTIVDCEKV